MFKVYRGSQVIAGCGGDIDTTGPWFDSEGITRESTMDELMDSVYSDRPPELLTLVAGDGRSIEAYMAGVDAGMLYSGVVTAKFRFVIADN